MAEPGSSDERGASGTGDNEWFTPDAELIFVRKIFGGQIELDPASSEVAQKRVKAKRYYDIAQDGLEAEVEGARIFEPALWAA